LNLNLKADKIYSMNPEIKKGDIVILSPGCSPGDTPENSPGAVGMIVEENDGKLKIRLPLAATIEIKKGNTVLIFPTQELTLAEIEGKINSN